MRLLLHIGMGKTGTSSIQSALEQSADILEAAEARYLGMWMDMIRPDFSGEDGQWRFAYWAATDGAEMAEQLIEHLHHLRTKQDIRTFVYSNESLSHSCRSVAPFVERLCAQPDLMVEILCYIRDPVTWLPSAYGQWGVRYKSDEEPLVTYRDFAEKFVTWYRDVIDWAEMFPDQVAFRSYEAQADVVDDFCEVLGTRLRKGPRKVNTSDTSEETILRTLFAKVIADPKFNNVFHDMIGITPAEAPSIEELLRDHLDFSATGEIVSARSGIFDDLHRKVGFDPRGTSPGPPPGRPDEAATSQRLLEITASFALHQAVRIHDLEEAMRELRDEISHLKATAASPARKVPAPRRKKTVLRSLGRIFSRR